MDPLSAVFITFGVLLLLVSWIYMLIISFKDDFTWGLTTLFLPPLSYLYGIASLDKAGAAIASAAIGAVLIFMGL